MDIIEKVILVILGCAGTIIFFFLRRKVEQKSTFENIEKTEKLISVKKEMDATGYTLDELDQFEKDLSARASAAETVSNIYKEELNLIKELKPIKTQTEMNVESHESLQKSETQLLSIIEEFKLFFSPQERNEFDKTNGAWQEFSKLNAGFMASRYEGGSIQPLIYSSTLESAVNTRIAELESELEYMKETIVPYDERDL